MGALMTNTDSINSRLRTLQNLGGAVPSPFECYLALRGLKTLHVRMEQAVTNAQRVAEFLEKHPLIEQVNYPGLASYPQKALAQSQTDGAGAVMAIFIKGGLKTAAKFLQELKVFGLAVSLGAVESLACSPALMTHTGVPLEARLKIGLTDSLIRLSIGIEHPDDLVKDLEQALAKAQATYTP
jgi:cystathionine gamma-lyase